MKRKVTFSGPPPEGTRLEAEGLVVVILECGHQLALPPNKAPKAGKLFNCHLCWPAAKRK